MKKLGKKIIATPESIEAYCQIYCCTCSRCTDSGSGVGISSSDSTSGGTYSHY
jgi:putative bacteriocin precursor